MSQIFLNAPIWVWPLLIVLIVIGLRARRDRRAPVVMIYCLPLLGVIGLRTVLALPAQGWVIGVFGAFYLIGLWGGERLQRRWTGQVEGGFVHLRGESLTLGAMMLIFWANFASGLLQAVAPQVAAGAAFQLIFAGLLGLVAGSFAGRAVQVWRAVRG